MEYLLQKLFNTWNQKKQQINEQNKALKFNEADIWWIAFGQNIGSETFGKGNDFLRPAIILRKVYHDAALVIPLTSKHKEGSYYFQFKDTKNNYQYAAMHQLRYVDSRRLHHRMSRVPKAQFSILKNTFTHFIKNNPYQKQGATNGKPKE